MVSIKDRKILRQMFSHYDYVMTTAQLSKEKLYYRDLQAVSESNGGVRYGEIKRFIRAGMYGADRNSGASGEALRYAAGSYLFPRLL